MATSQFIIWHHRRFMLQVTLVVSVPCVMNIFGPRQHGDKMDPGMIVCSLSLTQNSKACVAWMLLVSSAFLHSKLKESSIHVLLYVV